MLAFTDLAEGVMEEWLPQASPIVIGVGCGGPMRDGNRFVSPLNIPVWRDFPLRERLGERFSLPVAVENDAKALALGEGWVGAAKGVANYIAMVVSTGIGGGIVLRKQTASRCRQQRRAHRPCVRGAETAEPTPQEPRGNLEGQASGLAIEATTGLPPADAPEEVRRQAGEYVGRAVASVANLLDLQLAVVSGSVALGYGDAFFSSAQETIDKLCKLDFSKGTRIVPGGLGEDGPLIGAAAVGFQELGYELLSR